MKPIANASKGSVELVFKIQMQRPRYRPGCALISVLASLSRNLVSLRFIAVK